MKGQVETFSTVQFVSLSECCFVFYKNCIVESHSHRNVRRFYSYSQKCLKLWTSCLCFSAFFLSTKIMSIWIGPPVDLHNNLLSNNKRWKCFFLFIISKLNFSKTFHVNIFTLYSGMDISETQMFIHFEHVSNFFGGFNFKYSVKVFTRNVLVKIGSGIISSLSKIGLVLLRDTSIHLSKNFLKSVIC